MAWSTGLRSTSPEDSQTALHAMDWALVFEKPISCKLKLNPWHGEQFENLQEM
jgi:hypothetical protein